MEKIPVYNRESCDLSDDLGIFAVQLAQRETMKAAGWKAEITNRRTGSTVHRALNSTMNKKAIS